MMNKALFPLIVVCGCISYSVDAFQEKTIAACEKKNLGNTELSKCLDVVKDATEKELQTWINNQVFTLEEFSLTTGRQSVLTMFKRSQRNFITYRENNCRWQYLYISPSKDAASAFKKCYINVTKDRISELEHLNNK